jgi:hypothetical protein
VHRFAGVAFIGAAASYVGNLTWITMAGTLSRRNRLHLKGVASAYATVKIERDSNTGVGWNKILVHIWHGALELFLENSGAFTKAYRPGCYYRWICNTTRDAKSNALFFQETKRNRACPAMPLAGCAKTVIARGQTGAGNSCF